MEKRGRGRRNRGREEEVRRRRDLEGIPAAEGEKRRREVRRGREDRWWPERRLVELSVVTVHGWKKERRGPALMEVGGRRRGHGGGSVWLLLLLPSPAVSGGDLFGVVFSGHGGRKNGEMVDEGEEEGGPAAVQWGSYRRGEGSGG
ncbi:hypothetical protein HAX54_023357 [Datura stramonium]|uniref:Uncharacterized protein n=1 Tax=Datura stramonium TaxID=4076 RepID=A0ABS8UWU9_DATST|nr:hypothetical protein [Datura stramonium]